MRFFSICFFLLVFSCGQNPHFQIKSKISPLDPSINPINVEPELILREKNTNKEEVFDFGLLKKGDISTKDMELINVGQIGANGITFPEAIGAFEIEDQKCGEKLERGESCSFRLKFNGKKVGKETTLFVIGHDPINQISQRNLKSFLIAEVSPEVIMDKPRLLFFPKNFPSGPILLKDVPLFEKRIIELELRNTSRITASSIKLNNPPAPFKLLENDCPLDLVPDGFCNLRIEYSPSKIEENNFQLVAMAGTSDPDVNATQMILGNSIKLNLPAKLEVIDGQIGQDIYELIGIDPRSLSPFHEVRGVDVGILNVNKSIRFSLKLKNVGDNIAKVTNIRHFESKEFKYTMGNYPGQNGTCSMDISKGDCSIDIFVTPNEIKNISDIIELTYLDGHSNTRRLSIVLFASVRDRELIACKTITARIDKDHSLMLQRMNVSNEYKLPYKQSSPATQSTLQLLLNLASNQTVRSNTSSGSHIVPIVKNAMVQFGFDVKKDELIKYPSVKLELDILKISTEGSKFDTTEVLCLNENRTCSGTFFIDGHFGPLKTQNYQILSPLFSTELLRSASESPESLKHYFSLFGIKNPVSDSNNYSIFRLKKRISLNDLFGNYLSFEDKGRGLNFILADDSLLLGLPRLVFETDQNSCL